MPIIHSPDGDIFACNSQTLVCPVNTVGVMGNGLAAAFANRIKGLRYAYYKACTKGILTVGNPWVFPMKRHNLPDLQILCFPTKEHWKNDSRLEWIDSSLKVLARDYQELNITSLALPMIGCGQGLLDWKDVRPLVHKRLGKLPIEIIVFGP